MEKCSPYCLSYLVIQMFLLHVSDVCTWPSVVLEEKKKPKLGIQYYCAAILKGFSIIRHEKCCLKSVKRNTESVFQFVSSIDFVCNTVVIILFLILCPLPTYGMSRIWFWGILMHRSKLYIYFMDCMMVQCLSLCSFCRYYWFVLVYSCRGRVMYFRILGVFLSKGFYCQLNAQLCICTYPT